MGRPLRGAMLVIAALMAPPAAAQDIPGLEACTAEKQMERRTGCLQSNDEFLQRTLSKLTRDTQARMAAAARELTAAKAEIASLKSALEKLSGEVRQLREKAEPAGKK